MRKLIAVTAALGLVASLSAAPALAGKPKKVALVACMRTMVNYLTAVLAEIPPRFKPLVMTAIETGLRWGELVALRPQHVDFLRRTIHYFTEPKIGMVQAGSPAEQGGLKINDIVKSTLARTYKVIQGVGGKGKKSD